jgi:putative ABC transport system permease protein
VPFGTAGDGRLVRYDDGAPAFATTTIVGARYFLSVGLPLIAGREFTEAEGSAKPGAVAIVDRLFVERTFGGGNALGRTIEIVDQDGEVDDALEIVGVVPTVTDNVLEPPRPHLYVPFGRSYSTRMTLHARVAPGDEERMRNAVRAAILADGTPLPILSMRTLTEHRDRAPGLWGVTFAARLFGGFGLIAVVLATAGVYGLRAYLVARRTREIGIRLALGATRRGIVGRLLREGAAVTTFGLTAGLTLAAGLVQILQSRLMMDVAAFDPLTFGSAAALSAAATMAASYIPTHRALRIDPAVALRPE